MAQGKAIDISDQSAVPVIQRAVANGEEAPVVLLRRCWGKLKFSATICRRRRGLRKEVQEAYDSLLTYGAKTRETRGEICRERLK